MDAPEPKPRVWTISLLTQLIQATLAEVFTGVWVSGELCEVSRHSSGHIYLALKDASAQIRGVIWRSTAARLKFEPREGQHVVCCGDVDVYPPRGSYQLVIRQIEPLGLGAQQLALRQLQQKLAAEGLFDPRHKRPLPAFPRRVAIVTSPTSAAVRDFVQVAARRWPSVHLLVIPAKVQGEGAAAAIVRGIVAAHRLCNPPDVLVLTRGGGSVEDLWCFNDEKVVRAIFAATIPIVSAVGHEIDVTLADLVADVRALTPSEAAERVVPSLDELRASLSKLSQRLTLGIKSRAALARQRLTALSQRRIFRRPFERIQAHAQQLDDLQDRASRAMRGRLTQTTHRTLNLAARLESLSPLRVLARGYSVTLRHDTGEVLRSASSVTPGDILRTRLADGEIVSRVEEIADL